MKIKKLLFWLHLIAGCTAAIFIFLMSITGAALTYERQMIQAAERSDYPALTSQSPLEMTALLKIAQQYADNSSVNITLSHQANALITVKNGRKVLAYLNPYTGAEVAPPGQATKSFFRKLRAFHRWLTFDGSFSENGRLINGIANVIFIFLVLTGIYLWLPKRFVVRAFKQKLFLKKQYPNKAAKHFQWHNVYGIYMAPVLLVVVITAVFFSFKWPGETLKKHVSNEAISLPKASELNADQIAFLTTIDEQLATVKQAFPNWQTIQLSASEKAMSVQSFRVDMGNGGEPQKRVTVLIDALSGEITAEQRFGDLSTYRKARSYIRFLHTGEVFGLTGQTLAGIASLLACLLVYTGVFLSWRRWQKSRKIPV